MISHDEYDYFFNGENDTKNWNSFYNYYPNSFEVIQFSRIGFNNNFTEAVVNHQQYNNNGNGQFTINYLSKANGIWEIQIYQNVISN